MENGRPFLIGGRWSQSATVAPVRNPYTGETIAHVCQASPADAESALQSSVEGAAAMRRLSGYARSTLLAHAAQALQARQEEFARTMTAEAGKPLTDARREVGRAIHTLSIAGEEAKRIGGEVVPLDWSPGMESYWGVTRRFPIGPILGITPFNFPLNLVVHKVAPALAAGNSILIKPAPQTPLTALLLGDLLLKAGVPPGGLNILPCDNTVAEHMVVDPRFKLLSFTGSAPVGWMLKAKCGKKKVVLELGGNAAVIIEPDADLEYAAQRCVTGGFTYAGQTCISVQRIFVHASIAESFTEQLMARVRGLATGDPGDERTVVGPLIDAGAAQRIEGWIGEAVAQGARVLSGGLREGSVVQPTVLSQVTAAMNVSCREVFGPLVTITPYREFDAALRAVNESDYGLQAGIFTNNIGRIFQAFEQLEVGGVLANEIPTFRADHMPYGGIKDSGIGREGVRYAIEDMTEPKLLVVNLRRP
ncbi:MAG TPA: aldehyde dehydrogenase family protein [Nitrospira sp.]|nr:aldehyde dehydrogenase family protein [Nitrospira sp. NTP1]HQR13021.1 aldehyde dehydrogenase family protein [Nitrospira sp.]HQV11585.1 aldehyde dehydrogenase family protein [Nitrospira sp.]